MKKDNSTRTTDIFIGIKVVLDIKDSCNDARRQGVNVDGGSGLAFDLIDIK